MASDQRTYTVEAAGRVWAFALRGHRRHGCWHTVIDEGELCLGFQALLREHGDWAARQVRTTVPREISAAVHSRFGRLSVLAARYANYDWRGGSDAA